MSHVGQDLCKVSVWRASTAGAYFYFFKCGAKPNLGDTVDAFY